ncbi:hypothetical protein AQUCO_01300725v1 [Aquilegia coerulea]|uniref:CCHC-type domain-containing protein n=1 Tax=Aquilegia coerulea TaxID=218851 RepID=A0A2G5E360_AQUCA|nr:hypothetical protein AQUCO_01300725v1 [Aquilegia coerulea]
MGSTRSNFYKNPSFSYNKDFSISSVLQNLRAYNVAAGNTPLIEEEEDAHSNNEEKVPKRSSSNSNRRRKAEEEWNDRNQNDTDGGTLTHESFIEKRRKEIGLVQFNPQLTPDILKTSKSSVQPLVQYESDESSSSKEHEEKDNVASSDGAAGVKRRSEQRFAVPGEPVCVICGKYGEYICDVRANTRQKGSTILLSEPKGILQLSESEKDVWDFKQRSLCLYKCWKCNNPGHLAEDCLCRCHQIGKSSSTSKCNTCRDSSSLAMCLDCSTIFCDSSGHLYKHVVAHPSHQQIYSYKLQRLVKCCKSTCDVTDINNLLSCHHCLDKAFDKFYDMFTATWHRMNCTNAEVEDSAYIIKRIIHRDKRTQLSDFIF